MRNISLFAVFPFFLALSTAEVNAQSESSANQTFSCCYNGRASADQEPPESFALASNAAKKLVEKIVSYCGLKPNFEIYAVSSVKNAEARIRNATRQLLYNSDFMDRISNVARSDWPGVSIFAHEIGHHLQGHTIKFGGSQPQLELEADEFSGWVLQKMGATLSDAQAGMRIFGSEIASETHPAKVDRLAAIGRGYHNAAAGNPVGKSGVSLPNPKRVDLYGLWHAADSGMMLSLRPDGQFSIFHPSRSAASFSGVSGNFTTESRNGSEFLKLESQTHSVGSGEFAAGGNAIQAHFSVNGTKYELTFVKQGTIRELR